MINLSANHGSIDPRRRDTVVLARATLEFLDGDLWRAAEAASWNGPRPRCTAPFPREGAVVGGARGTLSFILSHATRRQDAPHQRGVTDTSWPLLGSITTLSGFPEFNSFCSAFDRTDREPGGTGSAETELASVRTGTPAAIRATARVLILMVMRLTLSLGMTDPRRFDLSRRHKPRFWRAGLAPNGLIDGERRSGHQRAAEGDVSVRTQTRRGARRGPAGRRGVLAGVVARSVGPGAAVGSR
jgi:hypothetical protein